MPTYLTPRHFGHSIVVVSLLACLPGCMEWHNLPAVQPVPNAERQQDLRVTLRDGMQLELRKARVIGDSIIGEAGHWSKPIRTAVALQEVQSVSDRRFSGVETALVVLAAIGALVVVSVNAALANLPRSI